MKNKLNKVAIASLLSIGAFGFMTNAQAAGTLAGTSISNTANLSFSVGGVAQTPKDSNTVSFLVDNKINLVLVQDNAGVPTTVTPGALQQIFKFKLTNLGNSVQDYQIATAQTATGQILFSQTDNFNATTCATFVDSSANDGVYQSANDTQQYVDELSPDASKAIFLRCNIPAEQINNDYSVISLTAISLVGGIPAEQGIEIAETTTANTAGVDVVFADGAGSSDAVRDGRFTARGAYLVQAATLSVVKTNAPICDPYNFTTNPKNIPGAFVRYSIAITNAAGAGSSANLETLTDAIDATNLTFDPNLIAPTASSCASTTGAESAAGRAFKVSCSGTGNARACATAPIYRTGVAGDDGFDYTGGTITAGFAQALAAEGSYTAGELKAGETVTLEFNAEVK